MKKSFITSGPELNSVHSVSTDIIMNIFHIHDYYETTCRVKLAHSKVEVIVGGHRLQNLCLLFIS